MSSARVAVVFGGRSSEHSISCISGAAVWQALLDAGYDVLPIAVTPSGRMVGYAGTPTQLRADPLPMVDSGAQEVVIPCDPTLGAVLVDGRPHPVDAVFPALHGPWGEDGTIQGLLELAGLAYVGSGVLASALCMDKITLKTVLRAYGLPVADWVAITSGAWSEEREVLTRRILELGPIVFVKPSRAGSSMGITRVDLVNDDPEESISALGRAVDLALRHDPRVIVEAGVLDAREIECAVLQRRDGSIQASDCAEIIVKEGFDFYDFEAKYLADGADFVVPAALSPEVSEAVRRYALRCFRDTGCEGLARVDFFVTDDAIVINELNTMPGFTSISMFPRMWQESGVGFTELVVELIEQARGRGTGLR